MTNSEKEPKVKLYWNDTNMTHEKTISVEAPSLVKAKEGFIFIKQQMEVES